jgi:dTDP-D-glucose 4,6-dehydratase
LMNSKMFILVFLVLIDVCVSNGESSVKYNIGNEFRTRNAEVVKTMRGVVVR